MKQARFSKCTAAFIALVLALQVTLPQAALAEQRVIGLDNHTVQTDQITLISGIAIDGVDKPAAGAVLDETATVTASGDVSWEVPVVWVRDDLQISKGQAEEGHTYLPALAFFVPQGYALAEDPFTATLSDSLTELFGTQEVVSVYDEATGITYIIPASLRDLFAQHRGADAQNSAAAEDQAQDEEVALGLGDGKTIVEIHCAQTARDALTDEDLEWLVDLIINCLQPQAVNLLLNNFGSMNEAAKKGEIGKEISLYVYFQKGDDDGIPEHAGIKEALAYVSGDAHMIDGALKYCYMLGMDLDNLVKKDENNEPVSDPTTGKYTLLREGPAMETFKNTMVHEMFHALMDDFNRTGMCGGTDLKDIVTNAAGQFPTKELGDRYVALQYPQWFIEGTASAVENVYQFRYDTFQDLRRLKGADGKYGTGELVSKFDMQQLIDNYVSGYNVNGDFRYYDLKFAVGGKDDTDKEINTEASRYVTGYLATLYLCDLVSRYNQDYKGSSVKVVDGVTTVDSNQLRIGLNSLLTWMHEGSTMDSLIVALSPRKEDGTPVYKDTATFQDLFIKGPQNAEGGYNGDGDSQEFVSALLNYFLELEKKLPEGEHPGGSILEDFSKHYTSMISTDRKESCDYLKIVNENGMIPSTVKSDEARIGGGRTDPDKANPTAATATAAASSTTGQTEQQQTPLPAAAKTANEPEMQAAAVADEACDTAAVEQSTLEAVSEEPSELEAEPADENPAEAVERPTQEATVG